MHQRLQPCAPEAATLCTKGCNPVHQRLQPCAPRPQPYTPRCSHRGFDRSNQTVWGRNNNYAYSVDVLLHEAPHRTPHFLALSS